MGSKVSKGGDELIAKLDNILDNWDCKMIKKKPCDCGDPIKHIVTESHIYCKNCRGVIEFLEM